MKNKKYLAFVFHAHLPYVLGHGTWPHGADWLFEAASETYIPLYKTLLRLVEKGFKPKITIDFTPVLIEQLKDERFKKGFLKYLDLKIEAAEKDFKYFEKKGEGSLKELANFWKNFYLEIKETFFHINHDIPEAFRKLYESGHIELITSSATHGYLPLFSEDFSIQAHIFEGVKSFKNHFNVFPLGIWPPELAYRPSYQWRNPITGERKARKGIDWFYARHGLQFFLIDTHLLKGGRIIGTYIHIFEGLKILWERSKQVHEFTARELTPYKPYVLPDTGINFFVRDPETAHQVWARDVGYPGDYNYLEFHKKHFPGGHRYWKITDNLKDLGTKQPYDPEAAKGKVKEHASHFVSLVNQTIKEGEILIAPYDAELLGHWWFEGPLWLENVIENLYQTDMIRPITLSEYLTLYPPKDVVSLPEGSWGEGGFHWVWFNQWTKWTWEAIYKIEAKFKRILEKEFKDPIKLRILKQAGREFLILTASDWQFLITTWHARDYAERRFTQHLNYLNRLLDMLEFKEIDREDLEFLKELEEKDKIFPDIEPYKWRV